MLLALIKLLALALCEFNTMLFILNTGNWKSLASMKPSTSARTSSEARSTSMRSRSSSTAQPATADMSQVMDPNEM